MSYPDLLPYQDPHTPYGVNVAGLSRGGALDFVCHECGFDEGTFDWNFRDVISPFWRLYYNLRPGNSVESEGVSYPLDPWRVLIVPEAATFHCHGVRYVPHLWLHFNFTSYVGLETSTPIYVEADDAVRGVADRLIRTFRHPPFKDLDLLHLGSSLLHLCLPQISACERRPIPERLHSVIGLIHSSCALKLSNAYLARKSGYSVEAFIRWFREHMGMPPATYVTQVRLQQAARQLALTKDSIEQIAADCGFPNRNYFTRVFALRHGSGPATFRKRYQQARWPEEEL